jgi:hypothetical protein
MALELQYNALQNSQKTLFVYDETGIFDPTSRPGAWGVDGLANAQPNIADIQDILDVKGITIVLVQNGISYNYNKTTADILALGFPNIYRQKLVLESSDFGLEKFIDGKATLIIKVAGKHEYTSGAGTIEDGFASEVSMILYFTKGVECCIDTLASKVDWTSREKFCKEPTVKAFISAQDHLSIINAFVAEKNYIKADLALKELQTICTTQKASCNAC